MSFRNKHWTNRNENRGYPLDDSATALSDQGDRLPINIITDMNLRYPETLGRFPFVSSLTVTPNLVSVTVQAAVALTDPLVLAPVVVFAAEKSDVVEGRPLAMESQVPGAGGWITFGSGIQGEYTGRFAGPLQGLIAPRAARAYRPFPVETLGLLGNAEALTGIVRLLGNSPIEVVKETREIDGIERDVIVIRLVGDPSIRDSGEEVNLFREFTGPCGGRPESGTCGTPAPIEFINTVPPDCDGNIILELEGCAEIAKVQPTVFPFNCGVVVDCSLGLVDVCLDNRLPDQDGILPNDYPDLCFVSEQPEESESLISESIPEVPSLSESEDVVGELPFVECFPDTGIDPRWINPMGSFVFVDDDSPDSVSCLDGFGESFATAESPLRSILVWDGFDDTTLERRVFTDVKMTRGPTGSKHNAGVIFNYRDHPTFPGRVEYFLAEVDYDEQIFRVLRWNGSAFVPQPAFVQLPGIGLDRWYRITVETTMGVGDNVDITAKLESVEDSSLFVTLGPLSTSQFLPATGINGIHVNRAFSRFSFFILEEL